MHADSARVHPQSVSPAAWWGLAVLVLLLGALALLLMGCNQVYGLGQTRIAVPNYYTCQVTCTSGFGIGAAVEYTEGGPTNVTPGGAFSNAPEPAGATGTIEQGPGSPANSSEIWWRVRFTGDNLLNWVPETKLVVIGGSGIVVQDKSLDVCVPGSFDPKDSDRDCKERVVPAFLTQHASELMPGTGCTAKAINSPTQEDESCNQPCSDPTGVCVTMGWDPDPPVPDPLSTAVFATASTCAVAGTAELVVDGHEPNDQPGVRGVLQILGRPCPSRENDEKCKVGVAFKLAGDDIEFDSGTVFASDPKFVNLRVAGATEPEAIQFGPFLNCDDCSLGALGPGAAFTTVQGSRFSKLLLQPLPPKVLSFRNTESVAVAVNWVDKICRFSGNLGGQIVDEDPDPDKIVDVTADVALDGVLVNQPPHPDPSATVQTVAASAVTCDAPVTLDGSLSTDPDNNIAFYAWRRGSETGVPVRNPSRNPVVTTPDDKPQAIGQTTYDLRVVDTFFAADHKSVTVSVVDTTAPDISCNAPATITPSDVPEKRTQGLSFKATATDVCSGVSQVAITGYSCTKPASCRVTFAGDTITILDSGGIGDVITWTVSATDAATTPNTKQRDCQVQVIKK